MIQFNIDLLNRDGEQKLTPLRYRDKLTEGYNISPNFFIYGYIDDISDFDNDKVERRGNPVSSFHFPDRLFDRDTLFVHQYKINFLYVLKSYTAFNNAEIEKFRTQIKIKFRQNFLAFFNDRDQCSFEFYECTLPENEHKSFVERNFRIMNGKCFRTIDSRLILGLKFGDNSVAEILTYFKKNNSLV